MKIKFKSLLIAIGVCVVLIGTNALNASALEPTFECPEATLVRVSVLDSSDVPSAEASKYMIRITCNVGFTEERYYWLSADLGESGYATLLTALSLNKTIRMFMTGSYKGAIITEMQVNN